MTIDALFFDFDGLILDTETADYESWRQVYRDHGAQLPRDMWVQTIGTDGSSFSPHRNLERATGRSLDKSVVRSARRSLLDAMLLELAPLPGVKSWIADAKERGIRLGVVSSSDQAWVEGLLAKHDLRAHFDFVLTRDDVPRVKPHPDLYLRALDQIAVTQAAGAATIDAPKSAPRAIALEDSPHGVSAAKAAGLFCVAIPGPMTRDQSFAHADRVLESLAAMSLGEMIGEV